jgi:TRAP-type uncharacterized transport system substrate-binding protein
VGDFAVSLNRIALRLLATILCVVASVSLALWYFIPAPPSTITIAAGIKGGAFEHLANRYKERLARHHITVNLQFVEAPHDLVRLINDPKSGVSAGFLFAGQSNSENSPDVVSLGRITAAPFWIFYRGPELLDRLSQLKGKRAYVTAATGDLVDHILAANGVKPGDIGRSTAVGAQAAVKVLQNGEVDVVILPPIDLYAPSIQTLLRDPNVRLMNVTQAEALTRLFPSLNRLVLPQGVIDLEKNIPPSDVNLIGSPSAFVARKELHPELIYLLAQTLKEVHSGAGIFQRAGEFPSINDPEFPVAEEALDYYKNGPSFLQRYLPFWMINYAKRVAAILLTAIAIVIPLFTYAPKLYELFLRAYLKKLYRRLRAIDARLQGDLGATEGATLQSDLDQINRAASILPMRHSDMFFSLRHHIDQTRTLLASRLATFRS